VLQARGEEVLPIAVQLLRFRVGTVGCVQCFRPCGSLIQLPQACSQVLQAQTGLLQAETGLLQAETGLLQAETGLLQAETGLLQAQAKMLGFREGRSRGSLRRDPGSSRR
jgi:hypothetical protein